MAKVAPSMSQADGQSFRTGPQMTSFGFGLALALMCFVLAAVQAWPVMQHYIGARDLAAHEPTARVVFVVVLLLAGLGISIALLEQRNARVELAEGVVHVHTWRGAEPPLAPDTIEALVLLRPVQDDTDLPFHWLFVRTADGRAIRLAGGPWPEPRPVQSLRHELADRLDLQEHEPEEASWALIFAAERRTWS